MADSAGQRGASRRIGDLTAAALLVAVGLAFLWRSLVETPIGGSANPGPGAAPLLLAVLLVAFSIWTAVVAGTGAAEDGASQEPSGRRGLRHAVFVLVAIAFAAGAIDTLGYRATVLAVLLFLLGVVERKPILIALLLSLVLAFGTYALFVRVMRIPLPTGVFGF